MSKQIPSLPDLSVLSTSIKKEAKTGKSDKNEGIEKNAKSEKDIEKMQDAMIRRGSGKPEDFIDKDEREVRIGFTMSGGQKSLLNIIQKFYPKKVGKTRTISTQDYIFLALTAQLEKDSKKFGINSSDYLGETPA